jgi:hypothetical protein
MYVKSVKSIEINFIKILVPLITKMRIIGCTDKKSK